MKLIIAGSRTLTDIKEVVKAMDLALTSNPDYYATEVVCGMAKGADTLGKEWAEHRKIRVKEFPAQWEKFGGSAGHKRNREMGEYADAAVVIWDGKSKGSDGMIQVMKMLNKPCYVHLFTPKPMNQLTDEDLMPWGKHKGEKMKDVPASYLLWMWDHGLRQKPISDPVRQYVRTGWAELTKCDYIPEHDRDGNLIS